MSPLLAWSLYFAEDFSDEILSAAKLHDQLLSRLRKPWRAGDDTLATEFMDDFVAAKNGIPSVLCRDGKRKVANTYICVFAGVGSNSLGWFTRERMKSGESFYEGAPLVDEPSLHIRGQPILNFIDFYEVNELIQLLATSCLIVISYISGMRAEECRGLQRGCCKGVLQPDGTKRYEIRAKSYKDALDLDGNAIHGGRIREEPWHVIEQVAKAIAVLEKIHDEVDLFSASELQTYVAGSEGFVMTATTVKRRISKFISWCNKQSERNNLVDLKIPDDPSGAVSLRRFRRTLAWFIYRQPAGRISLGIQYGHLNGITSDGYGSRASTGLRDLFPMEEALARADTMAAASTKQSNGEMVSGPAADRYIAAIEVFSHRFQGKYLTGRQLREVSRDPTLRIYDNGLQPLACCYDSTKAMCHPDRETSQKSGATPNLSRCDTRCPNVARTDSHIKDLRRERKLQIEQSQSELVPEPLRLRHKQRANSLASIIERHEKECKTSKAHAK